MSGVWPIVRNYVKKQSSHANQWPSAINYDHIMRKRQEPADTLITNLNKFMNLFGLNTNRKLAKASGVSDRMIGKIRNKESIPSIDVTEKLASAFGLTGWQLLIPDLQEDLAKSGKLDRLIDNYSHASAEDRDFLDRAAEQAAKFRKASGQ